MRIGLRELIDDERNVDAAESRRLAAAMEGDPGPQTEPQLLAARAALPARPPGSGPPAVSRLAEAEGRRVPVRVLMPEHAAPRGVYLDFHGGGFFMGSAARGDARNRRLADAVPAAVVSVDYRLAPEHPWPAAPDDAETAALWVADRAASEFGTTRLGIGGASAGANLAMTTLLRLRDRGAIAPFHAAVLTFGAYDLSGRTPAGRHLDGEYFIRAYAGHVPDRTLPDISPAFADLRGLPPALLLVGSRDIMLEDNLVMAARLSAAGGDVDIRVYPDAPHGFTAFPIAMADAARADAEAWLAQRFGTRRAPGPV